MDELIEISIFGEASVENNKVIVDYSELKKLTKNHYQLLEALENIIAETANHRMDGETMACQIKEIRKQAREAIKEAE